MPPSGPSPCTTWQFHTWPTNGRLTSSRPRSRRSRRTRRWWGTFDISSHWGNLLFCVNLWNKSFYFHRSLWIRKRRRRSAVLPFRKSCRRRRRSRWSTSRGFCTALNWRRTTGCWPVRIPHFILWPNPWIWQICVLWFLCCRKKYNIDYMLKVHLTQSQHFSGRVYKERDDYKVLAALSLPSLHLLFYRRGVLCPLCWAGPPAENT